MPTQNWWLSIGSMTPESAHALAARVENEAADEVQVEVISDAAWFCRAWAPDAARDIASLLRTALDATDRSTDAWLTGTSVLDDIETWLADEYDGL